MRPSSAANDGAPPWRTACAPRTIMLPAAWRKMWVSSVTGTAPASTSSANGLPAPTGASWSASPTSTTCVPRPDGAQERHEQLEVGHRGLVDDQHVGRSARRRVGPWPGTQPSAAWTVEASRPVDSRHPPRGAARRRDEQRPSRSCAAAAAQIIRIVAVLPVPGPPVTIDSRERTRARTAVRLRGRRARRPRPASARRCSRGARARPARAPTRPAPPRAAAVSGR